MSAAQTERIPKSLQAVFLASNRGNEVNQPPPKKVAFRTFFRTFMGKNGKPKDVSSSSGKNTKKGNSGKKGTSDKEVVDKKPLKTEGSEQKQAPSSPPKPKKKPVPTLSPQCYLDSMMRSRGYCTKRYKTLQTAYHNKPTPLQNASYDLHLIGVVKRSESENLQSIMAAGISPNPCNNYGESLVHMVCRRGDQKLLQIMIQNGCDIQVADDYGRTPLHDACWAPRPAFETVTMILDKDPTLLLMTDCRGSLPLSYVRKDHWGEWIEFLESKKNVYWPSVGKETPTSMASEYVGQEPNTRPLPDPVNALPLDLANQVASGKLSPEEACYIRNQRMVGANDDEDDEDDSEDDEEYDSDDSDYDSDDDDISFNEDEVAEIVGTFGLFLAPKKETSDVPQ